MVIGLVLGDLAENGFLLGRMLGEAEGSVMSYFFLRPIPLLMIGLTIASLVFTVMAQARDKRKARQEKAEGDLPAVVPPASTGIRKYQMNMAVGALAILFAFWADQQLAALEPETVVFPHVLLWIIKGVGGGDDPERAHLGPEGQPRPRFRLLPVCVYPAGGGHDRLRFRWRCSSTITSPRRRISLRWR